MKFKVGDIVSFKPSKERLPSWVGSEIWIDKKLRVITVAGDYNIGVEALENIGVYLTKGQTQNIGTSDLIVINNRKSHLPTWL